MRAVLQRVLEAKVEVEGQEVGKIGPGLLVFLGVGAGDEGQDVEWMVEKISLLRIFKDEAEKMNLSVLDTSKAILAVSQFTLFADTRKGRRPNFLEAMAPENARRLYTEFCERSRTAGLFVAEGVFAADMKVSLVNDGPVTLCLDSRTGRTVA